jgi:hypothetical protein
VFGRIVRTAVPEEEPPPSEFTTTFGSDENPLGSPWTNPNVDGFFEIRSLGGIAYGTAISGVEGNYPDCYAFHADFEGDYEIEAGIFRHASINTGANHEVELHVGMSQDGTEVLSVEWLVNQGGGWQCMLWSGINDGSGSFFSELSPSGVGSPSADVQTGDRMMFRKVGNVGTMWWKTAAAEELTQRWTVTLPHETGHPGIATYNSVGSTNAHFAFTDVVIRAL